MNRTIDVTTPLSAGVLRFDTLAGREALAAPFDFTLKSPRALHTRYGRYEWPGDCAPRRQRLPGPHRRIAKSKA